jgi:glutamine amidotransferase
MSRVAVVDYEAGNLKSVETALRKLKADYVITKNPDTILNAERCIFPGVGEARSAMEALIASNLDDALRRFHATGRPLLGICNGCQLVFTRSEERDATCLGLLPGLATRFKPREGLKVPHMGWNTVMLRREHPIFAGIADRSYFYFVHSYYPAPSDKDLVVAECEHGVVFAAAVARDNLAAVQFHPEKSGTRGLRLLANFLAWDPSRRV